MQVSCWPALLLLPLHTDAEAQRACAGAVEDAADSADDADVAGLADVDGRVAPVRMIEEVDRGKFRVQLQALRQRQLLVHAEIETIDARPLDRALGCGAEASRCGGKSGKRRGVKPALQGALIGRQVGVAQLVGT